MPPNQLYLEIGESQTQFLRQGPRLTVETFNFLQPQTPSMPESKW